MNADFVTAHLITGDSGCPNKPANGTNAWRRDCKI